jgi:uncharacterized membrane protein
MTATFDSFKPLSRLAIEFPPAAAGVVPVSRTFTWAMRLLCLVALAVTGYLAVTALRSGDVAGCNGGEVWDCGVALHSRWAKVLALPVSVPAFVLYLTLFASLLLCRPNVTKSYLRLAWGLVTLGAIAAGLAAVWFIGLQVFAVGHLCIYCLAAHACGLAMCTGILWKRPMGASATARLAGVSALAVSLLISTQVLSAPPPTYKVEYGPAAVATNGAAPSPASDAKSKQPDKPHAPAVFEAPSGVPAESPEN